MAKDKVMHPENPSREGGIKQVNTSIVKGPTSTMDNLTPYKRSSNKEK